MRNSIAPDGEPHRFRVLRLSDQEVVTVLDELDRLTSGVRDSGPRKRYPYRIRALQAHLGSPPTMHRVPTRWLSESGLAFLHGCLLYEGTYCLVQLVTLHGTWKNVEGTVCSCNYLDPHLYEVEVRFAQKIDPTIYCTEATTSRVLLVEDDQLTARMVSARFEQLNAQVDHAENGSVAVELVQKNEYDLVLMDIEMPVMDGLAAIQKMRADGYTGHVVAMSCLAQPDDQTRFLEAGFDEYLPKPFGRDELARLLNDRRQEPFFSSLQDDPVVRDLIREFVEELPKQVRGIQQAIAENDLSSVENIVRLLKGQGTSYGFEMITRAAAEIEATLAGGTSLDDVRTDLNRLLKLCALVRAPAKSD